MSAVRAGWPAIARSPFFDGSIPMLQRMRARGSARQTTPFTISTGSACNRRLPESGRRASGDGPATKNLREVLEHLCRDSRWEMGRAGRRLCHTGRGSSPAPAPVRGRRLQRSFASFVHKKLPARSPLADGPSPAPRGRLLDQVDKRADGPPALKIRDRLAAGRSMRWRDVSCRNECGSCRGEIRKLIRPRHLEVAE
jgi:hypothetical protein